MIEHNRVGDAVAAIAHGRMVLVADDADRENEGDLIMAAEFVTDRDMAFMLRHGSRIVCTPMSRAVADALDLPMMVQHNTDNHHTAFTVSVDGIGTGTGISAVDRAATVRALGSAATTAGDLRRPGHIFPLRARPGGTLERHGHTEAAVDLMRLAGCREVAVITELVDDEGVPMSGATLTAFAAAHGIPMLAIAELIEYRRDESASKTGVFSVGAAIPTDYGLFTARTFTDGDGVEHLVLTHGDIRAASATEAGVLVRVHSECLTGDVIGSRRCDCGAQLDAAMMRIAAEGAGVLLYLRGHEGRGIGLSHKLAAYMLQEAGRDTVDANVDLGLPIDSRDYRVCADILQRLDIARIRLITNNPGKVRAIAAAGVTVERISTPVAATGHNIAYLRTKRDRMGHLLDNLPVALPG
jgi:3,4-dihydroxy 2-butanone 4-phosphate synthase / GTP cyclohydrolase II